MPNNSSSRSQEWYVNIPFSDLHQLINQLDTLDSIRADNDQLRRELDGLRNLYHEVLTVVGDLRRELMQR